MMNRKRFAVLLVVAVVAAALAVPASAFAGPTIESVGEKLFFDKNLSTPTGQACADCHEKESGFADADDGAFSNGVIEWRFGNRNAPMAAYAQFSPDFGWSEEDEMFIGGQFWDGRAKDLVEQAKGPFLNPLEMNNPNKTTVVVKVMLSPYASEFRAVFGKKGLSLTNVNLAYDNIAKAIAAFERTEEFAPFDSKYDVFIGRLASATSGPQRMAAMNTLTMQERRGLMLFNGKAGCNACHPSGIEMMMGGGGMGGGGMGGMQVVDTKPLFTDFSYDNLGIAKNWDSKFLYLPTRFNPAGSDFIDFGLSETTGRDDDMGKFKVPSLRDVALTPPYGHNSKFETLEEIVQFYNTASALDASGANVPEVGVNVNRDELGALGLSNSEVADIVAFLNTLSDATYLDAAE